MTNKIIKAELKAYLDQLAGLVPERDRPLARELTHDVYGLFKELKKPEKETVYVKVPPDESGHKAEVGRLQNQLRGANGKIARLNDELESVKVFLGSFERIAHLHAVGGVVAGYVAGQKLGNDPTPEQMTTLNRNVLALIVRFNSEGNPEEYLASSAGPAFWEEIKTVCAVASKIHLDEMAMRGIQASFEETTEAMFEAIKGEFEHIATKAGNLHQQVEHGR